MEKKPKNKASSIILIIVVIVAFLGAFYVVANRIVVRQDYYCTSSCPMCQDCIKHTQDVTLWDEIMYKIQYH